RPASRSRAAPTPRTRAARRRARATCRTSGRTPARARGTRRAGPSRRTATGSRKNSRRRRARRAAADGSCKTRGNADSARARATRERAWSCPRRTARRARSDVRVRDDPRSSLLQVLDLLAHLLDQDLEIDGRSRELLVLRLRPERVRLAVHLLDQEIEPPADRLAALQDLARLGDVRAEPIHLFADVGPLRGEHELLLEAAGLRPDVAPCEPLGELLPIALLGALDGGPHGGEPRDDRVEPLLDERREPFPFPGTRRLERGRGLPQRLPGRLRERRDVELALLQH